LEVWIVNPFDPLPGDPEQEGRYAALARTLVDRGHQVTWLTSSFSHRFKQPVDQRQVSAACQAIGITPVFLPAPPYSANVSLTRLNNHRILARSFTTLAARCPQKPDVIVASAPPPNLAQRAIDWAHGIGAKAVVDIQDLWPETFYRLAPKVLQPLAHILLSPMGRAAKAAYATADAIVGVADAYVNRGLELCGCDKLSATIPLGIDLAAFDLAASAGRSDRYTKPTGETWLIYSGSLNRSYDCLTVVRALGRIEKQTQLPLRLFVTGRGELLGKAREIVRRQNLQRVHLAGFMSFNEWAFLLSQCDIGFNASFPEAMIFLPNKVFYYMAAGLAILNTIPGQCSRIISASVAGLDYSAGDTNSAVAAIIQLSSDPAKFSAAKQASRLLAKQQFDRSILMPKYAELLENL
jgi:glycosyltransferase involved in cell wall biosynthesis